MVIERKYVDLGVQKSEWEPISEEEFLRRTEWGGYWKKGTALRALKDAGMMRTPFAYFRIKEGT
jgi:hypothetical protein